jgi:hypothetical protein
MGLMDVGGGRERPDALWVWRAGPVEGDFCKRWRILWVRFTEVGTRLDLKVGGAEVVGGTDFEFWKVAPCCVYRLVPLQIH